ncbi:hypothetical protein [Streptomyces sp. NBC_00986]|uniref:hypothetical protein n=1 Tax=Streptomyces sp. NBC_00986 TaxID=2903702 RepID=UPI00386B7916|nr:hypothetical protein OG504_21730 [Streptomyces sp. NBC_00986]
MLTVCRVEPGFEEDPLVVRDYEPVREGKVHVVAPDRCSGGPVRLLDFDGQRARAAAEADVLWRAWAELPSGFPPARSLDDLIAEHPEATVRHAGLAWQRYAAQPLVRAVLDDADLLARFGQRAVGEFGVGRDRFLRRKADEALVRDALLTLDGSWVTPVSRRDDDYVSFFNTYVDELAPDTVLVNITYHS